jgi:hydroxymethylbilane synthase
MTMLKLGTRGSQLALVQSRWVAGELRRLGHEVELVVISTKGDQIRDRPLPEIGGKGLFTAELEQGLRSGELDLAVHSLKDLPVDDEPDLKVAAIPAREVALDALVTGDGRSFDDLPEGAVVGTSSTRRRAMLLAARPDLEIVDLRGNVPTRVLKVDEGPLDAAVLAAAGLRRLGMGDRAQVLLEPPAFLPAPGQGALGIQTAAVGPGCEAVSALDDPVTRACVGAERRLLNALGGGCTAPVGSWAQLADGRLHMSSVLLSGDGRRRLQAEGSVQGSETAAGIELGDRLARELLEQGGRELMAGA